MAEWGDRGQSYLFKYKPEIIILFSKPSEGFCHRNKSRFFNKACKACRAGALSGVADLISHSSLPGPLWSSHTGFCMLCVPAPGPLALHSLCQDALPLENGSSPNSFRPPLQGLPSQTGLSEPWKLPPTLRHIFPPTCFIFLHTQTYIVTFFLFF